MTKKKSETVTSTPVSDEVPESIVLECKSSGADAVYQIQLVASGGGWQVNFQNGRRCSIDKVTNGEANDI